MRKKILAGNWKMNTSLEEGIRLFEEIKAEWGNLNPSDSLCIIAPPHTHLKQLNTSGIEGLHTAAQNCSEHGSGAFTGEISAGMLRSIGADYVIVGHSERRTLFAEQNEILKLKVDQALQNSLSPIYCCGELETERDNGDQNAVVLQQIEEGLFHLDAVQFGKVVVAYEPVWAIGTGKTASPAQAQEMHNYIRSIIKDRYNEGVATDTTILYGGSCNADNADELFANEDVDGGLIGGASLKAAQFIKIAKSLIS